MRRPEGDVDAMWFYYPAAVQICIAPAPACQHRKLLLTPRLADACEPGVDAFGNHVYQSAAWTKTRPSPQKWTS